MTSVFAIVVLIALNVVPADLDRFQIVALTGETVNGPPVEQVIEFIRQPDGAWAAGRMGEGRGDRSVTFALNGSALTVTPPEEVQMRRNEQPVTLNVDQFMRVDPETNWATVTEFAMPNGGKAMLVRKSGQVTVSLASGAEPEAQRHTFHIRWAALETIRGLLPVDPGSPLVPAHPRICIEGGDYPEGREMLFRRGNGGGEWIHVVFPEGVRVPDNPEGEYQMQGRFETIRNRSRYTGMQPAADYRYFVAMSWREQPVP